MIRPRPLALIALLVAALAAPAIASAAIAAPTATASTATISPLDIASGSSGAQLKTRVRGFEVGSGARVDGEADATRERTWGIGNALRRNASGSLLAARGAPNLLSQFAKSTVDDVVGSAGRFSPGGRIAEGARALAKKLGHAESGGYSSAFAGVKPTQANAEAIIRSTLESPARMFYGDKVIDVYNAAVRVFDSIEQPMPSGAFSKWGVPHNECIQPD